MLTNALASVIVSSFNRGRFINETLDSIHSQDYRPIEVLVIDGASTDESRTESLGFRSRTSAVS
jgi:glycosyltransferase involved in cell wall biosynthesis